MKVLFLDIETAPNTAYVWGLHKENIPLARLIDSGYVLCWSAFWMHEPAVIKYSDIRQGERNMLKAAHDLLDEADVVIHYYGSNFDIPTLNKEFAKHGMLPPAPYKQIDLYKVVKANFRLPSYKLDYVAEFLGLGNKVRHEGFEMWIKCMHNDPQAWDNMRNYNIVDVELLGKVYPVLRPWVKNHPNVGVYNEQNDVCPNCGGHHLERRGFAHTQVGKYQRYQCKDCGTWSRGKQNVAIKNAIVQDRG